MTLTKSRPAVVHLAAFLAYALLTVLMTFPLVLRLADSVPGWPGDNLLYVWLLWWYKRALVDLTQRRGRAGRAPVFISRRGQHSLTQGVWSNLRHRTHG